MMWTSWLCLTLIFTVQFKCSSSILNFTNLGCWSDRVHRAIPTKEGDPILGTLFYQTRSNAIQLCAEVALKNGYQIFALQNGGWCATSATARQTYKKYGTSTNCAANGLGGSWSNQVHELAPPPPQCTGRSQINYKSLGCWQDGLFTSVIPSVESHSFFAFTSYLTRANAIEKCATITLNLGYTVFALQNGGKCSTSASAGKTYNTIGTSTRCLDNGRGGPQANEVYELVRLPDTWHEYNGMEYAILSNFSKTYDEAKSICNVCNATLALPKSANVRSFLQTISLKQNVQYWIGLWMNATTRGIYFWQDGSQLLKNEQNFDLGQPSNPSGLSSSCMITDKTMKWKVGDCSSQQGYICQRASTAGSLIPTTVPPVATTMVQTTAALTTPTTSYTTGPILATTTTPVASTTVQTTAALVTPTASSSTGPFIPTTVTPVATTTVQTTAALTTPIASSTTAPLIPTTTTPVASTTVQTTAALTTPTASYTTGPILATTTTPVASTTVQTTAALTTPIASYTTGPILATTTTPVASTTVQTTAALTTPIASLTTGPFIPTKTTPVATTTVQTTAALTTPIASSTTGPILATTTTPIASTTVQTTAALTTPIASSTTGPILATTTTPIASTTVQTTAALTTPIASSTTGPFIPTKTTPVSTTSVQTTAALITQAASSTTGYLSPTMTTSVTARTRQTTAANTTQIAFSTLGPLISTTATPVASTTVQITAVLTTQTAISTTGSITPATTAPVTSTRAQSTASHTTQTASFSIPHCNATAISVQNHSVSYKFPRTQAGLTAVSAQKCPNGNPIASVDCIIDLIQANKATFGVPYTINCSTTLATVSTQVNITNATTASVSNTMATLKLLTTNTGSITPIQIVYATNTLSTLSQTNPNTVNITINTMYDALITATQISASYAQSSNSTVTSTSSIKTERAKKQEVVKAINNFADRVIMPPQTTNIELLTAQTTLQVTEPIKTDGKHQSVTFGSPGTAAANQPVAAVIPGAVLDEASNGLRRRKRNTVSPPPVRASIVVHNTPTLFPASEKASAVISIQIRGYQPSSTSKGIQLTFTNITAKQGGEPLYNGTLKEIVTRTQCSVYRANNGNWQPNGCTLVAGSSPPRCTCFKLASFSMIVSTKALPSAFALGVVSYVGCSLSIIGLLITICIYLTIEELRRRQPTTFLLNICFNLLAANVIFIFGAGNIASYVGCYISAAFMHFFFLAAWFWMSANAFNMHRALTNMANIGDTSTVVPVVICYAVPFGVVIMDSFVAAFYVDPRSSYPGDPFFESAYRARNMCWLHFNSLHFGFLLPIGILALFNLACFISVMIKISCRKKTIRSTAQKRSKKEDFLIAISVCVVMGLTWLFGFLMMIADNVAYQTVMSWLFTIFNSTQGLFIFLMNCVRQKKVRDMWWLALAACFGCKRKETARKDSSISFTQATRV